MSLEDAKPELARQFFIKMMGPNNKIVELKYDPSLGQRPWRAFEQQNYGFTLGGSGASLEDAITDLERVKVDMSNGDEIFALVNKLAQTEQAQAVSKQTAPSPAH